MNIKYLGHAVYLRLRRPTIQSVTLTIKKSRRPNMNVILDLTLDVPAEVTAATGAATDTGGWEVSTSPDCTNMS